MNTLTFILLNPQMGENIGAVARAMSNFGLTDLRIVAPRDGWPNPAAVAMAAHGTDVIENATVVDSLKDALKDVHTIYATTPREDVLNKTVLTPKQAMHKIATTIPSPIGGGLGRGHLPAHRFPTPRLLSNARNLRKDMTEVEQKLWYRLRREQLGAKFRRQHPIGQYVVDFACLSPKLIIELDGGQHNEESAHQYDTVRTTFLNAQGFEVVRFWNNELHNNFEGVLETIHTKILTKLSPLPNPPPMGEGTKTAILFGAERAGLSNEDIVLADAIISIPVNAENPSLNLAQAAVVIAYEWFSQRESLSESVDERAISQRSGASCGFQQKIMEANTMATKAELEGMFEHAKLCLDKINYFREANKTRLMWQHLRSIWVKSNLTSQEVRTLRGVLRAIMHKLP